MSNISNNLIQNMKDINKETNIADLQLANLDVNNDNTLLPAVFPKKFNEIPLDVYEEILKYLLLPEQTQAKLISKDFYREVRFYFANYLHHEIDAQKLLKLNDQEILDLLHMKSLSISNLTIATLQHYFAASGRLTNHAGYLPYDKGTNSDATAIQQVNFITETIINFTSEDFNSLLTSFTPENIKGRKYNFSSLILTNLIRRYNLFNEAFDNPTTQEVFKACSKLVIDFPCYSFDADKILTVIQNTNPECEVIINQLMEVFFNGDIGLNGVITDLSSFAKKMGSKLTIKAKYNTEINTASQALDSFNQTRLPWNIILGLQLSNNIIEWQIAEIITQLSPHHFPDINFTIKLNNELSMTSIECLLNGLNNNNLDKKWKIILPSSLAIYSYDELEYLVRMLNSQVYFSNIDMAAPNIKKINLCYLQYTPGQSVQVGQSILEVINKFPNIIISSYKLDITLIPSEQLPKVLSSITELQQININASQFNNLEARLVQTLATCREGNTEFTAVNFINIDSSNSQLITSIATYFASQTYLEHISINNVVYPKGGEIDIVTLLDLKVASIILSCLPSSPPATFFSSININLSTENLSNDQKAEYNAEYNRYLTELFNKNQNITLNSEQLDISHFSLEVLEIVLAKSPNIKTLIIDADKFSNIENILPQMLLRLTRSNVAPRELIIRNFKSTQPKAAGALARFISNNTSIKKITLESCKLSKFRTAQLAKACWITRKEVIFNQTNNKSWFKTLRHIPTLIDKYFYSTILFALMILVIGITTFFTVLVLNSVLTVKYPKNSSNIFQYFKESFQDIMYNTLKKRSNDPFFKDLKSLCNKFKFLRFLSVSLQDKTFSNITKELSRLAILIIIPFAAMETLILTIVKLIYDYRELANNDDPFRNDLDKFYSSEVQLENSAPRFKKIIHNYYKLSVCNQIYRTEQKVINLGSNLYKACGNFTRKILGERQAEQIQPTREA
ncbi:hypothetical protein [Rickettsiales endosymbiont of Stachyamoeba lipophora]|uniref:hypothetical protein n=1 Tax=Rickettsiales endosymbiont of Stachyamoeba lipophora TaxID=2486578 RepID=UPI000F645C03|nr:hypothetical protein [Rickettsiales endosymbiont of Stachyamoeba lipophora]AZL16419.1 hypothetical protein EF513_07800 [Rickettsiales endosymbiont of Stachyamoeba lipophora]